MRRTQHHLQHPCSHHTSRSTRCPTRDGSTVRRRSTSGRDVQQRHSENSAHTSPIWSRLRCAPDRRPCVPTCTHGAPCLTVYITTTHITSQHATQRSTHATPLYGTPHNHTLTASICPHPSCYKYVGDLHKCMLLKVYNVAKHFESAKTNTLRNRPHRPLLGCVGGHLTTNFRPLLQTLVQISRQQRNKIDLALSIKR